MSGRGKNTSRQSRSKTEEQPEATVDIELRDQIVEAVEPLISNINEQIVETVRESLSLNGDISADGDSSRADDTDDPNAENDDENKSENEGAQSMAEDRENRSRRREGSDNEERDRGRRERGRNGERDRDRDRGRDRDGRGNRERAVARRQVQRQRPPARRLEPDEIFDPRGAVPVALLRLGNSSLVSGSIYTAIYAYTQVLERYPDTGAANAATENLLRLAAMLQDQGRFYTALNILNQIEELTY
jgi:tetratricopeptide (TPR) repeat protein